MKPYLVVVDTKGLCIPEDLSCQAASELKIWKLKNLLLYSWTGNSEFLCFRIMESTHMCIVYDYSPFVMHFAQIMVSQLLSSLDRTTF